MYLGQTGAGVDTVSGTSARAAALHRRRRYGRYRQRTRSGHPSGPLGLGPRVTYFSSRLRYRNKPTRLFDIRPNSTTNTKNQLAIRRKDFSLINPMKT